MSDTERADAPTAPVDETLKGRRHPEKREEVVRAGLAIADRDGYEAVSMRRVANELGWGTMTLYSYVSGKEDLEWHMAEALGSTVVVQGALPPDWRDATRLLAGRIRQLMITHPWLMTVRSGPLITPAFAHHIEQTYEALADLEIDLARKSAFTYAVYEFTIGCALDEVRWDQARPDYAADVSKLIDSAELPHVAAVFSDGAIFDFDVETQFRQGLDWLIAGFEASLPARQATPPTDPA